MVRPAVRFPASLADKNYCAGPGSRTNPALPQEIIKTFSSHTDLMCNTSSCTRTADGRARRMPMWLQALMWGGTLAGGALVLGGAGIAWVWKVPPKIVSTVMAFGAGGVLISALAFELVDEAVEGGGLLPHGPGLSPGRTDLCGLQCPACPRRGGQASQALRRSSALRKGLPPRKRHCHRSRCTH